MATRNETITLSDADMKEAVKDWLTKTYGPHDFSIQLTCHRSSHGEGWAEVDTETFGATATRKVS